MPSPGPAPRSMVSPILSFLLPLPSFLPFPCENLSVMNSDLQADRLAWPEWKLLIPFPKAFAYSASEGENVLLVQKICKKLITRGVLCGCVSKQVHLCSPVYALSTAGSRCGHITFHESRSTKLLNLSKNTLPSPLQNAQDRTKQLQNLAKI